jgi:hypothetical protein
LYELAGAAGPLHLSLPKGQPMFRIKLIIAVFGGILVFWGVQEFRVSQGTSAEPVAADLAALESGQEPPNPHMQLGAHLALYPAAVYEYSQSKYASGDPGPTARVNHCYYPIMSVPDAAPTAGDASFDLNRIAVLVRTKRFRTIGDIPDDFRNETSITGLVVNRIQSLDKQERKLILESFPTMNLDKVLILEDARRPASLAKSGGMIGGGLLLGLIGVAWMFLGTGSGSES